MYIPGPRRPHAPAQASRAASTASAWTWPCFKPCAFRIIGNRPECTHEVTTLLPTNAEPPPLCSISGATQSPAGDVGVTKKGALAPALRMSLERHSPDTIRAWRLTPEDALGEFWFSRKGQPAARWTNKVDIAAASKPRAAENSSVARLGPGLMGWSSPLHQHQFISGPKCLCKLSIIKEKHFGGGGGRWEFPIPSASSVC